MPSLDWTKFDSLSDAQSRNFENLCRGLMRNHYGRFGDFKALANQPGVEFHIKLNESCSIGNSDRWIGWQCKLYKQGELASANRTKIEKSLRNTESILPDLTDWILWTRYTLSKKDQEWYYALQTKYKLHLWAEEEIDNYLSGDGLMLRSTYFGEQVLTPHNLAERHTIAIKPIRERWMEPVHQAVDAERTIRRMLGEAGSWGQLIELGECLKSASELISPGVENAVPKLKSYIISFVDACIAFADTLTHFHEILANGDLDVIQQKLQERKTLISLDVRSTPRRLRSANHPASLSATNALDDMFIAQELLDEAEEFLGVGLVAILADAGGGKTQMAAQLTAPQKSNRPAGIFLQGRNLHKGQSLNDLAKNFSIDGTPMPSMESLLAAVDAAGKRSCCRLPILIDGLNEAENPNDWRFELASLSEIVKKFPNVLVVSTLRTGARRKEERYGRQESQSETRESFAVMALPDGIKTIESEGFGGDINEAIDKYFSHFKIDPGDAEIPLEFLQHPLTLRIFCEVTNPKRVAEVKVDYFPASLSPLFEKYVANAAKRISEMSNLSYPYTVSEVNKAIYTLGIELWNCRKREVNEVNFRTAVSDNSRSWDSSIVNLLTQEGIIFRNPSTEPYEYVITPTYDALGGYIIANALLLKHDRDRSFEWLNQTDTIALFTGNTSHELAFDILRSLVTLTPRRMGGKQIWQHISDPLKKTAIALTAEVDAEYLDTETVAALLNLLNESPKSKNRLFARLQAARAVENHPLNADFLDSTLREMSVSKRDLIWTEWVRSTRSERFNDLLALEEKWKQKLDRRTLSDRLRAKWVMWLLTSTDRELRDVATRALYWFGRGNPTVLFEETLTALSIDDPYVPERMLAASYGVAMAKHVDLLDRAFVTETLPKYARSIYDSMFAAEAPFSTTHCLMREYASRILEMASFYNSQLFSSEEIKRSKSPFQDGGLREWGEIESSRETIYDSYSPLEMDFEKDVLSSLVPDHSYYNFNDADYLKVKSQILWRIEQFGWSSELFKDIESSMAKERAWDRAENDAKTIERYGKKYSWIAFFEMSGLLHDLGKIERSNERDWNWNLDIDPSFPAQLPKTSLVHEDFLGNPDLPMSEWIVNEPPPDINPYLQLAEIQNETGSWMMLDGYIAQENRTIGRSMFCFIRSFLVLSSEADSFLNELSNQDLGRRWLPEKPSANFTFGGEIPWCETFIEHEPGELTFVVKEEIIKVERMQKIFFLDDERLDLNEFDIARLQIGIYEQKDKDRQFSKEDIERIEVREIPVEVEEVHQDRVTYTAIIPACDFRFESERSTANDDGFATVLSKEIASNLDLIGQPQTFDYFTNQEVKATYYVSDDSDDFNNNQRLFYIKEDLLNKFLDENELSLIWAVWGERKYSADRITKFMYKPDRPDPTYVVFQSIKRYE